MSKEKWSEAKTKRFIASYIKQSSLWNVSDPDYALRAKKEIGYKALQEEFGLTLTEVKNKIRIYRTTYQQSVRKMDATTNCPKLAWFDELHKAFNQGKIKSFTKTPRKSFPGKEELIEIEYQDSTGGDEDEKVENHKPFVSEGLNKQGHQIIIEPLEDEYEEIEYQEELAEARPIIKTMSSANVNNPSLDPSSSSPQASTSAFKDTGIQSNELFLKSLQATLDRLPDAKNMRARIKIQEVLYKIAYGIED